MSSLLYLLLKNSSNSHHNYYVPVTVLEERRGPQTLKTEQRMVWGAEGEPGERGESLGGTGGCQDQRMPVSSLKED